MKRNNSSRQQLTPVQLYAKIVKAIADYHLKPSNIIPLFPLDKPRFTSDQEVIDEMHRVFDTAGDPYSRIVRTDNAGSDIDPEDDDDSPDVCFERIREGQQNLGLVRINQFRHQTCSTEFAYALKALSDCHSLILDLRDNPGGLQLEALAMSQMMLNEGNLGGQLRAREGDHESVDFTLTRHKFITTTSALDGTNKSTDSQKRQPNLSGDKPIVVLVNENTKSAAEVLASILQENGRAKLIGKRTYGKGRGTNNLKVSNGLELQVLGLYWFTPNGQCIGTSPEDPNKGIVPDYLVTDDSQFMPHALRVLKKS